MESEENMKKHLNIVEWNNNNSKADKIHKRFNDDEQNRYNNINRNYSEREIFTDLQKLQNELHLQNKDNVAQTKNKHKAKFKKNSSKQHSNLTSSDFDYLLNKPKNYIIVGGLSLEGTEIDEVIKVIKSFGQVSNYNIVNNLNGN